MRTQFKSKIRLRRQKDGSLRLHDIERNFQFSIHEFKEKNEAGVSVILESYSSRLHINDLFKLASRLEKDDTEGYQDWPKNWNYLFGLERNIKS